MFRREVDESANHPDFSVVFHRNAEFSTALKSITPGSETFANQIGVRCDSQGVNSRFRFPSREHSIPGLA
jgi:hypothetical protein